MKERFVGNSAQFLALRKRLDILGYTDLPLGIDSAPLARQMMEDLVATTEALANMEQKYNLSQEQVRLTEAQVEPIRADISRLTRENSQLHQRIIASNEKFIKMETQYSNAQFDLESENRRIRLISDQAHDLTKNLQKQVDILRERLQDSAAVPTFLKTPENLDCYIKFSSSGKSGSTPEIDEISNSNTNDHQELRQDSAPDSDVIRLLHVELENLRKERDEANQIIRKISSSNTELEKTSAVKDEEIKRLSLALSQETGRDGYLTALKDKCTRQENEIQMLQAQLRCSLPSSGTKKKQGTGKIITTQNNTKPKCQFSQNTIIISKQLPQSQITNTKSNQIEIKPNSSKNLSEDQDFVYEEVNVSNEKHDYCISATPQHQKTNTEQSELERIRNIALHQQNGLIKCKQELKLAQSKIIENSKLKEITSKIQKEYSTLVAELASKNEIILKLKCELDESHQIIKQLRTQCNNLRNEKELDEIVNNM